MEMSREEILKKVQEILVDALGVDEEDVVPKAVIRDDLGAESIDFLDISFRLEKAFPIGKINTTDMTMPETMAGDPNMVKDGMLTPAGLEEVKKQMPYADYTEFEKDPKWDNIGRLFTVEMLVNFVEARLKAAPVQSAGN